MARRRILGAAERALLGAAFGVIAWFIERRVLRAIKRGTLGEKKEERPALAGTAGADGLSVAPKEVHE